MTHEERLDVFDQLRAKHLRFLTAVLWKLTGDREIFAEAMQYALLDLWRHLEKLGDDKARGYLHRIALSANSKAWRTRVGRDGDINPVIALANSRPGIDERANRVELAAKVRRAVAQLPTKQSKAILMRHLEQQDYGTIAKALGCSEAGARSHVSKALATLKKRLTAAAQ